MKLDISVYQRRWQALDKNREHMRDLILKLMENPATEPEHLACHVCRYVRPTWC
jgi:hypothetical protein